MGADQTYAVNTMISVGDLKLVIGTYANASGSTGGAVSTGLAEVFHFESNCMKSQSTTEPLIAISAGVATMTVVDNEDGQWMAIGI